MILLTGTPGTGKTSISKHLSVILERPVVHLNKFIKKQKIYDRYDRSSKTYIVDVKKLKNLDFGNSIVEGHLSHYIKNAEVVVVLRCSPAELEKRLKKKRWSRKKIYENVMSEMLDVILTEAEEIHGSVIQVDTTNLKPEKAAKKIIRYIKKGKSDEVSWLDKYENILPNIEKTLKKIKSHKS